MRYKIAQIGYGYWGTNLARTLALRSDVDLKIICDEDPARLAVAKERHLNVNLTNHVDEVFKTDVDAVFVVTPPESHYRLTKQALLSGKAVFVEKPIATNLAEADELISISEKAGLTLFVDHVLVYSEPVKYLKRCVDRGDFGDILYINSRRINLGLFQHRVDVIWDLAIHDISVIDHLIGFDIERVSVFKKRYPDFHNDALANINVELKCGTTVSLNVSWLSPVKVREMIIGGVTKMAVYDDVAKDKIQVYDHGVVIRDNLDQDAVYEKMVQYRLGDIHTPDLKNIDCLQNALDHFFDCLSRGTEPLTGKSSMINTIKALEVISRADKPI